MQVLLVGVLVVPQNCEDELNGIQRTTLFCLVHISVKLVVLLELVWLGRVAAVFVGSLVLTLAPLDWTTHS